MRLFYCYRWFQKTHWQFHRLSTYKKSIACPKTSVVNACPCIMTKYNSYGRDAHNASIPINKQTVWWHLYALVWIPRSGQQQHCSIAVPITSMCTITKNVQWQKNFTNQFFIQKQFHIRCTSHRYKFYSDPIIISIKIFYFPVYFVTNPVQYIQFILFTLSHIDSLTLDNFSLCNPIHNSVLTFPFE